MSAQREGTHVSAIGCSRARIIPKRGMSWRGLVVTWVLRRQKLRLAADFDVRELRGRCEGMDRARFRVDALVRRSPVDADGVACEWISAPESRESRLVLYFHGGAFALRFPNLHARYVARLCRATRARGLIVDYRLAPEHPYPAAVEDCLAAYRWLLAAGWRGQDIVLAGDSAGGNLVLVVLQRIRNAGEPLPSCAVVLSPPVDLTMSSRSFVENERRDAVLRLSSLLAMRQHYVPPQRLTEAGASPLFGDLAGLPPLLLQAGECEVLRDDAVRFADAAREAGVHVECEIWPGMQHVFPLLQFLPESARAIDSAAQFMSKFTDREFAANGRGQPCAA
jgi:acetyl esterase/lipase